MEIKKLEIPDDREIDHAYEDDTEDRKLHREMNASDYGAPPE